MANDGRDYEIFVATLQYAVMAAEDAATNLRNFVFERNKKIVNSYGVERQFDVYWEYQLGGLTYKTVIECKDYDSPISVDRIDGLIGKIRDIPDLKPVFATKTGYQSGATKSAEHNKVELLIARKQNDSDWTDQDGTPLIRVIPITITLSPASHIHDFKPAIDGKWVRDNTDMDISQPMNFSGMNNEIFVEDNDRGQRYSLRDLASRLVPPGSSHGRFQRTENFANAYLCTEKLGKLKMSSYTVDYTTAPPITESFEVDFGQALVGVIEYLGKGEKKLVFKDQVVTEKT